ncbi:MAG: hypothetical protein RIS67_122 [Pseudomonadota bacterium]
MPEVRNLPHALPAKAVWWFFAIAFVVLFAGYGLRDPWPADEPRFVLVAKQMVESGNWLFPHRGIELYPDKPPVYFWLLALAYFLIGSWRWSFLLPSLLSGMAVLWLVYDLGKRLWQPRAGLWAAAAVLVSLQFMYQFKRAQIDPTLVLMTTASFYLIARHVLLERDWRMLCGGFALAGLGVITKGVGFLPLLALLPLAAYRHGQCTPLTAAQRGDGWRWLGVFGCFLLPIALWLSAIVYLGLNSGNPEHAEYLNNILFKQTAERYANPWHHHEPFWYFAEIIALFWLPFSLSWFWLITPWRKAFAERDLRVLFPLAWGVLVVLFFSISSGKRDMYILPALPAFALAAAPYLHGISERRGFRRALLAFVLALGLIFTGLGIAALSGQAGFAEALVSERGLGAEVRWLWWMLVVCGGISLVLGMWARTRQVLTATAISLGVFWIGYGLVAYPVLDASSSARNLMQQAFVQAGPGTEIGMVAWKEQNLLQARGNVTEFGFRQPDTVQLARGMAWMQESPQTRLLLVHKNKELACIDYGGPGTLALDKANRRSWWLVNIEALAGCAESARAE